MTSAAPRRPCWFQLLWIDCTRKSRSAPALDCSCVVYRQLSKSERYLLRACCMLVWSLSFPAYCRLREANAGAVQFHFFVIVHLDGRMVREPFVLKNTSATIDLLHIDLLHGWWGGCAAPRQRCSMLRLSILYVGVSPTLLAFTDCQLQVLLPSTRHSTSSASIAASAAALSLRLSPWLSATSAIRLASCCLVYSGWVAAHRCRSGPHGM